MLHLKTLFFYLVKEGLAILILWLHGTIAYTLFAYTVQKVRGDTINFMLDHLVTSD